VSALRLHKRRGLNWPLPRCAQLSLSGFTRVTVSGHIAQ
jgi:hypothetical protein